MELSERLKTIALLVDECDCLVDVGTDHGYIPIFLIKNKMCNSIIASDINNGPLTKARHNILLEGLQDSIECRLGNGLSTVFPGEVQCAIIAGMGGNLIRDIINNNIDVVKQLSYAILQPIQNSEILREYLYNKGFNIIDEELCEEEGKFYEIIKASYGNNTIELQSIFYEISPLLIRKRHRLINKFINNKFEKYNKIYNSISEDSEGAKLRKIEILKKISILKEILDMKDIL